MEHQYNLGQKSVQDFYDEQERQIKKQADEIFSKNFNELQGEIDNLNLHNASLQKKIKEFNAKKTVTCSPPPEYLSLWDSANSNDTGTEDSTATTGQQADGKVLTPAG